MLELPTTFGKYYLTEKLATGGMAEIYLAKIVGPGGFEKQLVLKQIHPKLTGQRHFVDLFVAEAKTLVTLTHGNIVPVYELGVVDDIYFIAMEYIDGPTLYRFTEALQRREGEMAPALAAWITARILEGLDYAHRKGEGVIHRDLSPRNVMLSRDGEVKLVDFGIAVTLGAGTDDGSQSAPTGSFPYMSPEQVRREPLTGQTDLFSVGVLCWEMLVGKRLFARPDPDATLAAVTGGEIPKPSTLRPEIPARLDEVVMRALERDMANRWTTAAEMLAALQKFLYALDDTPGPRDLAAMIARFCPPETRRLPTHTDPPDADGESTVTHADRAGETKAAPSAGPRTAVIPRDGATPRGRPHRTPTRQESFATHVGFHDLLERGTGQVPAIVEPPTGPSTVVTPRRPSKPEIEAAVAPEESAETPPVRRSMRLRASSDLVTEEDASEAAATPDSTLRVRATSVRDDGVPVRADRTRGPGNALLLLAGLGATALSLAAIWVFVKGRDAVLAPDAALPIDAAVASDAGVTDAPALLDAPFVDATPVVDAADTSLPRDAGPKPPPRDAASIPLDASVTVRPIGTATLKIGADPWGEVVVDGVAKGRAPLTLQVSAGKHLVEIVFAGEEPPRKKAFPIDVSANATEDLFADFTKP
ncbi:MAG: protein kinase [Kofleriaceae bacterium]|nr:protein kinase [Kofleriaceae bacterium]